MRYFLTGGSGFIGGRVAALLRRDGHEVVALVRDPARAEGLRQLGAVLAVGDITDRESMRAPMAGVDGVFHVAGWYKVGVRDKRPAVPINVEGTRNVLTLMGELGVPKGVYTSTLAVFSDTHGRLVDETYRYDGPHLSEYDRTKWLAHYQVAEPLMRQGLPLVIVMPGVVYGPGDTSSLGDSLRLMLRRRLPVVPRGTRLTWAHVDDVARGHILAMERGRPGETYIIAGPDHALADVFATAARIAGVPAPRALLTPGVMRALSRLMAVVERVVPVPAEAAAESLRSAAGVTYIASNAKARRELGYAPRPLEQGLRDWLGGMAR